MTDLSNNGSGADASAGEAAAAPAKPKGGRKTTARTSTARSSAARTSTQKKAPMADETKTTTSSTASARSAAEERLRATLQQIETRAEELRRWGMARQEMAREVVEERPLAVVGVAFGVGLLLGLIASRV